MNFELTPQFTELKNFFREVQAAEDNQYGEIEPMYERLLEFLKKNASDRENFSDAD